jgi:hypothetical protein
MSGGQWTDSLWWVLDRLSAVIGVGTFLYFTWRAVAPKLRLRLPVPAAVRLLEEVLYQRQRLGWLRAVAGSLYCRRFRHGYLTHYEMIRLFVEYQLLRPRPHGSFICPRGDMADASDDKVWQWDAEFKQFLKTVWAHASERTYTIEVNTCFELRRANTSAERYFKALPGDKRFAARVRVRKGFIAPLHLLTGLLDQAAESWPRVIEAFGADVRAGAAGGRQPALQASMLNIWLLWGPSIPLCQCAEFASGTSLQYGYGDENMSVPVYFDTPAPARTVVTDAVRAVTFATGLPPTAVPASVTAVPHWGGALVLGDVSKAHSSVCRYPIVLRGADVKPSSATPDERYYTAYVWVMFVLTDERGVPLYRDAPWRALYPLFEHTNIANPEAYLTPKVVLAQKAVATMMELSTGASGPRRRFAYACAFDEARCSPGGVDLVVPPPDRYRLRDMMIAVLKKGFPAAPPIFNLNADPPSDEGKAALVEFSACHLPRVIERYYAGVVGGMA